jgi:hypothetical protein
MSELLILHNDEIDSAIAEYIRRCDILLEKALFKPDEIRAEFREWISGRFRDGDALMLLHDAPLYVIGRYLGKQSLSAHVVERATALSISMGWTRT